MASTTFFAAAHGIKINGTPNFNHVNGDQTNYQDDHSVRIIDSYNTSYTNNHDSYNASHRRTYKQYKKSDKRKATNATHLHADWAGFANHPFQTDRQRADHWPSSGPSMTIADRPFNETVSADDFMRQGARGRKPRHHWDRADDSDFDSESGEEEYEENDYAYDRPRSGQHAFARQEYEGSQSRKNWDENEAKYKRRAGPDINPDRPVYAPEPHSMRNQGPAPHPSYYPPDGTASHGWYPPPTRDHPSSSHHPQYPSHLSPYPPPDPRYPHSHSYPSHSAEELSHSASGQQQPPANPPASYEPIPGPRPPSPSKNPFHPLYRKKQNTSAPPSTTSASSPPPDSVDRMVTDD